eukprot:scaffold243298_cov38-Prasinocladus_malaysianus.AAC.1
MAGDEVHCVQIESQWSALPQDVTKEIAQRLPAYMAVPVRCVSKTWKAGMDKVHGRDGAAFRLGKGWRNESPRDNVCLAVAAAGGLDLLKWFLGKASKWPK